jgi:hypothetical protein
MQEVAQYKSALASCAIEGNEFGAKHLKAIEGMILSEEYVYLKSVFDYLKDKYN